MSATTTARPSAPTMRKHLRAAGQPVPTGDPKALVAAWEALADQATAPKATAPTAPAKPAKDATPAPASKPAPANCGCGCGQPTVTAKARFLSGHDARHAGNLGRALAATPDDADLIAARDALSDLLQAKVASVQATATRKVAEKAAREVAKAAAKQAYEAALATV